MNFDWVAKRIWKKSLPLFAGIIFLASATFTLSATAQEPTMPLKEQIIGTWDLVANYAERQDGSRLDAFGPSPSGRYILDAGGRFSYMIYGSGRPKFASNNRREGSPEENKTAVQGMIAFFGTYIVDEATHTVTWHVERCPNGGIRPKNHCDAEWE